jgi:hypothetical protein
MGALSFIGTGKIDKIPVVLALLLIGFSHRTHGETPKVVSDPTTLFRLATALVTDSRCPGAALLWDG